jgi:haloalkane dehalogenase
MYWWQVGRFFRDAEIRNKFVPLLYQQFDATPSTRPAFFSLNQDLLPTIRSRSKVASRLKELSTTVL